MNRRTFTLSCGASFLATACANSSVGRTVGMLYELYSPSTTDAFDPAYAKRLPYASLAASIGKGPRSLLVLGKIDGADLHWFSADKVVLVTHDGRLVRTAGLPANLANTTWTEKDSLLSAAMEGQTQFQTRRQIDLMPNKKFGIPVIGEARTAGPELVTIFDTTHPTIRIVETCRAPLLNWEFENHYWVELSDQKALVRKSIQHYAPGFPPVTYELIKPPLA